MDITPMQSAVAILFYRGEPVSFRELASLTKSDPETLESVLNDARERLESLGLTLVKTADEVELRTSASTSELIEVMRKEELTRDLGKAGLEALSIILYNGPVTRADIEYIRGVNSTAILRNLLIRGLVEKVPNPKDQRSFIYKPSVDLLAHLGIRETGELPEYTAIRSELDTFAKNNEDNQPNA